MAYNHDNLGNILNISDALDPTKNQEFRYDGLNRLNYAKGTYGEGLFQYDPTGNLRNKGIDSSVTGSVNVDVDIHTYKPNRSIAPSSVSLNYNDPQHPFAVTSDSNGNSYSYDQNGNMINRKGVTLTYDKKNQLVATSNGEEYTYDYTGQRIRQKAADGKIKYNISGLFEVTKVAGNDDVKIKYIYGMNGDLVARTPAVEGAGGAQSFIVGRHIYSPDSLIGFGKYVHGLTHLVIYESKYYRVSLTIVLAISLLLILFLWIKNVIIGSHHDELTFKWAAHASPFILMFFLGTFGVSGCFTDTKMQFPDNLNALNTYYFHPNHNGSVAVVTNGNNAVVSRQDYTPYGGLAASSTGTDIDDKKFTGQELDSTTGLYYYGARYYDPEIGRFISPDSIIDGPGTSQGWNRYMYVHGNPVMNIDPTGFSSEQYGDISVVGSFFGVTISSDGGDGGGGGYTFSYPNVAEDYGSTVGVGASNSPMMPIEVSSTGTYSDVSTDGGGHVGYDVSYQAGGSNYIRGCHYNGGPIGTAVVPSEAAKVIVGAIAISTLLYFGSVALAAVVVSAPVVAAYAALASVGTVGLTQIGRLGPLIPGLTTAAKGFRQLVGRGHASKRSAIKNGSDVTDDMIRKAMQDAPLTTQQAKVSKPMIQRYVDRLIKGDTPPPIKVDKGIIVDGNHRYVAGRLMGKEPKIIKWSGGKPSQVVNWKDVVIDFIDWGGK